MNIEFLFLRKAIKDKNYISFKHDNVHLKNVKASKITEETLYTNQGDYCLLKIKKVKILKERY